MRDTPYIDEPSVTVVDMTGAFLVHITGRLDASSCAAVENAFADVLDQEPLSVLADLSKVESADGVGIDLLHRMRRATHATATRFAIVPPARPLPLFAAADLPYVD